ncbi:hypothetical protein [Amphritea sp.]|uniref:hypothetical protein n=1 Tax=Amphritea sp. TaxID=1872502 RepID=UPI0025C41944|nr:hypothetical protein [Amphritea sp.]
MLPNILFSLIVSLPIVGLLSICRSFVCGYRSYQASKTAFVILSVAYILIMLIVLAFDLVVLFGYGVAHTGKSSTNDLIVLSVTVIPTYVVTAGLWLLCRYMERRLA